MNTVRKIAIICTTLMLAAATGHVMQSDKPAAKGEKPLLASAGKLAQAPVQKPVAEAAPQARQPQAPEAPSKAPEMRLAEVGPDLPGPDLPGLTRADAAMADLDRLGVEVSPPRALADAPGLGPLPADVTTDTAGFGAQSCDLPKVDVASAPSASVHFALSAPCLANSAVTIRHEGLALPVTLDAAGAWSGVVPAMAVDARFVIIFSDATELEVTQVVSGLSDLNRIAIRTESAVPMQLHGIEYGADFGTLGDVNASAPREAATELGGWMAVFGSDRAQVQIYSAPAAMTDIRLDLEAAIDAQSCGQTARATAQRLLRGVAEAPAEISLDLPDCADALATDAEAVPAQEGGAVLMQLPDFPLSLASLD